MNPIEFIPSDDQLNEIAQDIDIGFRVFIHKQTGALLSIPDFDNGSLDESEFWEETEQPEINFDNYYEIERPR